MTEQQYDLGKSTLGAALAVNDTDHAEAVIPADRPPYPNFSEGAWLRDISMHDGVDQQPDDGPPVGVPGALRINGEVPPCPVFDMEILAASRNEALAVLLTVPIDAFEYHHATRRAKVGGLFCLQPGTVDAMEPEPVYDYAAGTVAVAVYVRSIVLGTPPAAE